MVVAQRAAVIGLGRMGSTIDDERGRWSPTTTPYAHTPCYRAAGVEVVAGADPHESQRAAYQQKWGVQNVYADYREMLERERPNIVSVCTSAKPRARIVQEVVEIGAGKGLKAIWGEKPISFSLEEADAMIDACARASVVLAIGCSRNWSPSYNRIREVVDVGEIGTVIQVIGMGQAGLSHNGSHLLATTNFLAGSTVEWVFGHMASDEKAVGDDDLEGNGYLQYASGAQGFVRAMPSGGANWDFELIGTIGRIRTVADAQRIDFWKSVEPTLEGRRREPAQHLFPMPWNGESPNVRTVRDLLLCIGTGKRPNCSGEDGRHALEVAIALRESHRRGGVRVNLPLEDRSLQIRSQETLGGDEPAAVRRARAAAR